MGGYSKGCFACRRRKVKVRTSAEMGRNFANDGQCDEARPTCHNCNRRGDRCRFQDPDQFSFRSMNGALAAKYDAVRGPTLVRPSTDQQQRALMLFFHNYVLPPGTSRRGHLEFLPDMYQGNPQHMALKHALTAVSMAHLANVSNQPDLALQAQSLYGLGLRSVADAMSNPNFANDDCGLTSIVLLQKYEVRCFFPADTRLTFDRSCAASRIAYLTPTTRHWPVYFVYGLKRGNLSKRLTASASSSMAGE